MKIKTIILTAYPCYIPFSEPNKQVPAWRVEQVTDSIEFTPGDMLRKDVVDDLCASSMWKVTIKKLAS